MVELATVHLKFLASRSNERVKRTQVRGVFRRRRTATCDPIAVGRGSSTCHIWALRDTNGNAGVLWPTT
ncbi:MAG: hypothetical protein EBS76_02515 [Actinobacteria bacterium]|nr:hypothetical protein [Actinomycetota bacterium]